MRAKNKILFLTAALAFGIAFQVKSQSGIDSLENALAKTSSDSLRVKYLIRLSTQYQYLNFSKAENYTEQALAIAEDKKWDWAKLLAYKRNSKLSEITGNYTRALKYANLLLKVATDVKDSANLYTALNYIGYDYADLGKYDDAYSYFSQSYPIAVSLKDSVDISTAFLNIGSVFKALGQFDLSIENLKKSEEISALAKDYVGQAYYLDELGDVYQRKGEYDKSETALLTSLPIARKWNESDLESRTLTKLGKLYASKKEYAKSLLYYDSAASLHRKTDNDFGLAENNLGKGEVLMAQGKNKEAQILVQESLKAAKALNARNMERDCFNQLAVLAEKENDFKKALEYYKTFQVLDDSLFGQEMLEKLFQEQLRLKTLNKDFQIADLSKAKTSSDSEVKKQEFIRNILVVVLALTGVLLFSIYRSGQRRIKINALLLEHQDEIKRRSEELEQLNEVKDKFFSIISHDLRSPINALSGILNLLEKQSLTPQEFSSLTKELRVQFNSTKTLINNLLDWALLQMDKLKTQPENIDLRNLVDENVRMLSSYHLKEVNFTNEISTGTVAYADLNMVNLVFRNLILNAIKFTETGGQIVIGCKNGADSYTLSVADNGVGISPEVQQLLFEKTSGYSTRGTANEKGTGLGLILCKEFVEKNGGRIWMDSIPGKGSTFYFTLKKPA